MVAEKVLGHVSPRKAEQHPTSGAVSEPLWRPSDRRPRVDQPLGRPSEVTASSSEALGVSAESVRQSTGKE
ncbi:MAG TPA: hypothetical protein VF189_04290 [Patescibacteria group bacterium]